MTQKFTFYWLDGTKEEMEGRDEADAFAKLGYGAGAIGAVDYVEGECEPLPV